MGLRRSTNFLKLGNLAFNPRVVANALSALVAAAGAAMLIPAAYSLLVSDGAAAALGLPAVAAIVAGAALFFLTRSPDAYIARQDVFLIVVAGWVVVAAVGSVPYVIVGVAGPVDAFFNAMAGFTTTGASTFSPEGVPPSILLWRSLTQWAGGIGIVVVFVAVGPLLGFGAAQLLSAEVANPVPERMTPRIRDTAKVLAYVYGGLTLGGIVALTAAGMSPFDAVNHALTTVSTGGYSTHSESIASFDSWALELAIVVGMVLSGANFALYFRITQGRLGRTLKDPELLTYLGIILAGTTLMTVSLYAFDYRDSLLAAFRAALFQSTSLLTGTAFETADWDTWSPLAQALLMLFMAIGGMAGSTTGGIKVIRLLLLVRHAGQQMFHMLHPQSVTPLRLGHRIVSERLRQTLLGFFFVYMGTLVLGTLLIALHQVPIGEAFGSVFACLNLTGTSLGQVGNPDFYAELPATAKGILTVFMLLGRLELFTVLVILTPAFWRG